MSSLKRFTSVVLASLLLVAISLQARAQSIATNSLKVLSFNTWMLEIADINLASNIKARRALIAREVSALDVDVVSFIEVWQDKHSVFFAKALAAKFPYCSYTPKAVRSGAFEANGLIIFSKWPLEKSGVKYSKSGCQRALDHLIYKDVTRLDEYFVSKGAIHNIVHHPRLGDIDLYTAHFGALTFDTKKQDYNRTHQAKVIRQTHELISFIEKTKKTQTQIVSLDSNRHFAKWSAKLRAYSDQLDTTYSLFLQNGFIDSFMKANAFDPRTLRDLYSFDSLKNTNASTGHFGGAPSEFIDYLWLRSSTVSAERSRFVFDQPYASAKGPLFLSDHFGIVSEFVN